MRSFHYGLCVIFFSFLFTGCAKQNVANISPSQQGKGNELQCYQMFTALQSLDRNTFKTYQKQFSVINSSYEVYKKNQTLIDNNSSEIIRLELNNKIDVVCARVRSAVFASMAKRANELNKL